MKRLLIVTLLLLGLSASGSGASDTVMEILIDRSKTDVTSARPRSVVSIPIHALWNSMDNGVHLYFADDIGNLSVVVLNLSTGEVVHDFIDTADGQASLYTSGTSGLYSLSMQTEYGETFEGEFYVE